MDYQVEDVEFLRHGEAPPLLARLYVPHGPGPFRAVVELHGGVWSLNDRTHTEPVHIALAKAGIAVAALDFRQGADGAYPLSVADAHYGIRWAKANAAALLKSRADLVGVCSQSSGTHIAALIAIRPHDPRYASIPLPPGTPDVDATFRCLAMFWPVVNPIGRYRLAKALVKERDPPDWAVRHIPLHDAYWGDEASMAEGSPLLALERGEARTLPPALYIQPRVDQQHIYEAPGASTPGTDLDKFVDAWRATGAPLDLVYYDAPPYFTTQDPRSDAAQDAFARVVAFFRRHIPDPGAEAVAVSARARRKPAEAAPPLRRSGPSFAFVQSLERGLAVIRSFDHAHAQQTVADVARRTGLDRAAARRFLLTLAELGYIEHDDRDRHYRLSPQTLQLGYAYLASLPWWQAAQRVSERMTARIGVSSAVGVLEQQSITYVAYASAGRFPLLANRSVGTQLPAAATAIGRVLLAALPAEQLRDWLAAATLEKYTAHTLATRAGLTRVLAEVRAAGFAMVDQELAHGLRSIGVPIRNRGGAVVAGMSVSVLDGQVGSDAVTERYLGVLQEAAAEVTRSLAV